ncbi:glycoside hydrolase family 6 protein [Streptomyces sp. TRM 70351]|uniref:glycoside hydrolase family 6 protein n=1 Tax=Streptomyces sp. TRM 70351 TaxID=3116552 RepID=UPI002E7B1DD9|nr:glycoside hydrolase family 6 protein [Streptomyces sp. TRM 70351]MEE1928152.1 glycoside hydrolase family 6 protein [Streptomyces sp. TRM 70351]
MYGTDAGRRWHGARARLRAGTAALGAALLLAACSSACSQDGDGGGDAPGKEAARDVHGSGASFWVNPEGRAARALVALRDAGLTKEAELVEQIAAQPAGEWVGTEEPQEQTARITGAAEEAGQAALLVLYNIPHRDCGQYSQGGARDADAYREWIDQIVAGIGDREAWIVLEPDALPHLLQPGCVPAGLHEEQYALLSEAVGKLAGLPDTRVYLDAGNPRWVRDAQGMVEPLRRAGIGQADGFSLNVSNYETTEANIAYGRRLSAMVGGKPFVIDTSRNGNGPAEGAGDAEAWCNPPGRALGEEPTADTGEELVDAYLWVKRPGESDGTCKGGPPAGDWYHEYALELAGGA